MTNERIEKIKEGYRNLTKAKKVMLIFSICFILLMTSVFAWYIMSYQKQMTGSIVGSETLFEVTQDLPDTFILNVSEGLYHSETLILQNDNNLVTMNVTEFKITYNYTDLSCDPISNELIIELLNSTGVMKQGQNFQLKSGTNYFYVNATAINPRICPVEIVVDLSFEEAI